MLKILYALAEKYEGKEIFIYGIGFHAMSAFAELSYCGIDITGFVNTNKAYEQHAGKYIMNRRIVVKEELVQNDSIVVVPREISKTAIQKMLYGICVLEIDELLAPDYRLRNKKVIIYGIGQRGNEIYDLLESNGIKPAAACVSEKKQDVWKGLPVYSVDELEAAPDIVFILATKLPKYRDEMLGELEDRDAEKYIDLFLTYNDMVSGDMYQIVDKAFGERKNIFLYGNDDELFKFIEKILNRYGVNIGGRIYEKGNPDKKIESIYELIYKELDNTAVIVAEWDRERSKAVCDQLSEIGFCIQKHNYTSIYPKALRYKKGFQVKTDCLLGYSPYVDERFPGYVVYGDAKKDDLKIMVLGGSTSTDGYYQSIGWPYFFWKKFQQQKEVTVYNGAMMGHDVVQELLKLLRDIAYIRPDVVISMGGLNNVNVKKDTDNQFCVKEVMQWITAMAPKERYISGVKGDECTYEFWHRNLKVMKAVVESYGAKFFGFLQPMNVAKDNPSLFDILTTGEDNEDFWVFRERAGKESDPAYRNLISLFDQETEMYIDYCHYSEKANEVLADSVFKTVITNMKENLE
ncbi:MAG: hypothetical protein K2I96_14835 [Lachnospiraceae bacterium]|nr:hypothetical protein [Lachnospiraceae bacterium]